MNNAIFLLVEIDSLKSGSDLGSASFGQSQIMSYGSDQSKVLTNITFYIQNQYLLFKATSNALINIYLKLMGKFD